MTAPTAPPDDGRYFSIDVPLAEVPRRSARSGFIQVGAQVVQGVILLCTAIVLARLLAPADFGLFAMVNSLMMFVFTFRDFGLPMAALNREGIDQRQASGLFWLTLRVNAAAAILMAALAPALARFYGEPRLTAMTVVTAAAVLVLGLAAQHEALLQRQMRFGALMGVEVVSLLVGLAVAVGSAMLSASYWALVFQFLAFGVTRSVGLWLISGWRPARGAAAARASEVRAFVRYGGYYTGARVLDHVGRNLDRVLVGYFGGATAVGLYDNAFRWAYYPIAHLYVPLTRVVVGGLSRLQNDRRAYVDACRRGLLLLFAVALPVLAFLAVEAERAILIFMGARWVAAAPIFALLCIAAYVTAITRVTSWLYLAQGDTHRQLRWALIQNPVLVLAVAVGVQWGAYGVAVAFTVATWVLAVPAIAYCLKDSPLRPLDFAAIVWRPVTASAGAAAAVLAARPMLPSTGPAVAAAASLGLYVAAYATLWLVLPGGVRAAGQVLSPLRSLRFAR